MKDTSRESSFIRHWVRIRIDGYRPERLISQAVEAGIRLRNIVWKDETEVCLSLTESHYKRLRKMAKSRYRVTIILEGGAVAAAGKIKHNRLAVFGLLLAVSFYLVQMCFVREINVLGCEKIPEDQVREILAEEGLYEGALKNFDCDKIEKRLFREYESVVWAKVSYQGRYVQVEIAEGDVQKKEILNRENPCNLVAEKDCYIERVYTYRGRSQVKEGDFVKKGGILIMGTVPVEHPSYPIDTDDDNGKGKVPVHYVHAEGEILARVPYYFSFYLEGERTKEEMESALRQWIKENVPEKAEILNKDFHFEQKKNIIKLYGIIETRQTVGVEKEIVIDKRQDSGIEESTD